MANEVIVLLATCVLLDIVIGVGKETINVASLKKKLVTNPTLKFAFKLCGKPVHAEITDVMPVGMGANPTTGSVAAMSGVNENNLHDMLRVHAVQETGNSGKVTYKTPPNPEAPNGVFLPSSVAQDSCGNKNVVSYAERKAIAQEVLKKANSAA